MHLAWADSSGRRNADGSCVATAVTCRDGTVYGGVYRLATTLLDARAFPAETLMRLYHERCEHETAYLALLHTLLNGRVLRSGSPARQCAARRGHH